MNAQNRNAPCPCGSGKRFKRYCNNADKTVPGEIVQYRATSRLGPAVIASASISDDGTWACVASGSVLATSRAGTATTATFATFSDRDAAVAWLRETAGAFVRAYVARPGEPTDAVVLPISASDKRAEAEELRGGLATPTDLDWRLYNKWRMGTAQDCGVRS